MSFVKESRPLLWSSGQSSWLKNGDVLCFPEVRPEFIYVISWLQIQKSGFDSRRYQIFRELVGLHKAALGQVFSEYFGFPCKAFGRLLHTHHRHRPSSSGAGTVSQIVAHVPNGLSLTPPQEDLSILIGINQQILFSFKLVYLLFLLSLFSLVLSFIPSCIH
jgi:hypothetical protein